MLNILGMMHAVVSMMVVRTKAQTMIVTAVVHVVLLAALFWVC